MGHWVKWNTHLVVIKQRKGVSSVWRMQCHVPKWQQAAALRE